MTYKIISIFNIGKNGDWGLGIGDLVSIPNPQSPIPKLFIYKLIFSLLIKVI